MLLEQIKTKIDTATIVSFDIFDTLLLRPYCAPSDVFHHIEHSENKKNFAQKRINAEHLARKNNSHKDDITIDDIYAELEDDLKYIKDIEIEFEKNTLFINREMQCIYDYACQFNKTVIITSDMYLPSSALQDALRRNDICHYDRFYLSCEQEKSKWTGRLFEQILADYPEISPEKILHIGDNKISDHKIPESMGISSVCYEKVLDQFIKHDKRARLFYTQKKDLSDSILLAYLAKIWIETRCNSHKNYWHELGRVYAGPVIYAYANFIYKKCIENGIKEILFIARDGYTLKKAFAYITGSIDSHYVYAPRVFNELFNIDKRPENSVKLLTYFDEYIKENCPKASFGSPEEKKRYIQDTSRKFLDDYTRAITSLVKTDDVALVDTITEKFSAQKLLEKVLGKKITGFYWYIMPNEYTSNYDTEIFSGNDQSVSIEQRASRHWPFMEFLFSSPELPVYRVDQSGKAIYISNPSEYERYRCSIYPDISEGALEFVRGFSDCFSRSEVTLSCSSVIKWINLYLEYPQEDDFHHMKNIKVGNDSFHREYIPLIYEEITLKNLIFDYIRHRKKIKRTCWMSTTKKIYRKVSKLFSTE